MSLPNHPNSPSEALTILHDQVLDHGATIDAVSELRHKSRLVAHTLTQTAILGWSLLADRQPSLDILFTYPQYATGAVIVAETVSHMRKLHMENNINLRETEQDQVRTILQEPVDVGTNTVRGQKPVTVLHWQGADKAELTTHSRSSLLSRLEKIATATVATPVSSITMDKAWLETPTLGVDLDKYGADFIAAGKKTTTAIIDSEARTPFVMTPEKCLELVRDVRELNSIDVRQYLIAAITKSDESSMIPSLFQAWIDSGSNHTRMQGLKYRIRSEVERYIDSVSSTEINIEKDEEGIAYRVRQNVSTTVQSGMIRQYGTYKDADGKDRHSHLNDATLLSYAKAGSVEEILSQVASTSGQEAAVTAKIALLLLLQSSHGIATDQTGSTANQPIQTYFQRIAVEQPWRKGLFRTVQVEKGMSKPLILDAGPGKRVRFTAAILSGFVFTIATLSGLAAVRHETNVAQQEAAKTFQDKYGMSATADPAKYAQYLRDNGWATNPAEKIIIALEQAQLRFTNNELAAANNHGIGQWLNDFVNETPNSSSLQPTAAPPDISLQPASMGDVNHTAVSPNQILYAVTSYNGATTDGYWATQVNDALQMSTTPQYPFSDASITFRDAHSPYSQTTIESYQQSLHLPAQPPQSQSPAYKLTTPYSNPNNWTALPIKNGTRPVAVRLEYTKNGGNVVEAPAILYDKSNGTYFIRSYDTTQDMPRTATLTYWLANDAESFIHARGPLQSPSDINMQQVAKDMTQALGLPANASSAAIESKIQHKKYSFTPFSDFGLPFTATGYNPHGTDNTHAMSVLGTVLAATPEAVCNTADAQDLLATDGKHDGRDLNMVVGYHSSGGAYLTSDSLHAWAVEKNGLIVDPTPHGYGNAIRPIAITAPLSGAKDRNKLSDILDTSEVLVVTGLSALAFKRRRKIASAWRGKHIRSVLEHSNTQAAITLINQAEWDPEIGSNANATALSVAVLEEQRPVIDRMKALPPTSYGETARRMKEKQIAISPSMRRAIKRIVKWRQRILDSTADQE